MEDVKLSVILQSC